MAKILKKGSGDSNEIKKLQLQLRELANAGLIQFEISDSALGVFGPRTEAAVKQFQAYAKIDVDGTVGDETRARLQVEQLKLNRREPEVKPETQQQKPTRNEEKETIRPGEGRYASFEVSAPFLNLPTIEAGSFNFNLPVQDMKPAAKAQVPSMEISPMGKALTKVMEGYGENCYTCPTGHKTIGYGTTGILFDEKRKMPKKVTPEQAEALLEETYKEKVVTAKELFGDDVSHLRQNERDGLMSLVYNLKPESIGQPLKDRVHALATYTGDEKGREKLVERLADKMREYDSGKVDGKLVVLPGLKIRREAEALLVEGHYEELSSYLRKHGKDQIFHVDKNGNGTAQCLKDFNLPNFAKEYAKYEPQPEPQFGLTLSAPTLNFNSAERSGELTLK